MNKFDSPIRWEDGDLVCSTRIEEPKIEEWRPTIPDEWFMDPVTGMLYPPATDVRK